MKAGARCTHGAGSSASEDNRGLLYKEASQLVSHCHFVPWVQNGFLWGDSNLWEVSREIPEPLHSSSDLPFLSNISQWVSILFSFSFFEFQAVLPPVALLLATGALIDA